MFYIKNRPGVSISGALIPIGQAILIFNRLQDTVNVIGAPFLLHETNTRQLMKSLIATDTNLKQHTDVKIYLIL